MRAISAPASRRARRLGGSLAGIARAFREPVPADTRAALRNAWERLPERLRGSRQFLGRQYAGCGATIGLMPRCDFACRGCYLGSEANRIPPLPVEAAEGQIDALRRWLGEGGNLQLTDGEVALRSDSDIVRLCRYSRAAGLVPMLMTHGEGIRREPERLVRWMTEGGLSEVSIHIDSTQRGRRDPRFRSAVSERELMPLRDEFASLVRWARAEAKRPLDVATTVTVTRENLAEVPEIVAWLCRNADAFKMVSFQPVAAVGRTEPGVAKPVDVDALWEAIRAGLPNGSELGPLASYQGWLGHPGCSRFVQGVLLERSGQAPAFHPLLQLESHEDVRFLESLLEICGGLTLRLDRWPTAAARLLGLLGRYPRFAATQLPRALWRLLRRIDPNRPGRLLLDLLRRRARLRYLNLVSHHFMSAAELASVEGQERLATCAFQVPIDGQLVSMCEANAAGHRDSFYADLALGTRNA